MHTIKLASFNKKLVIRSQAQPIREAAETFGYKVCFDLTGLEFMTSSTADEIFGKGSEKFGMVFKIKGANTPYIRQLIKNVILTRKQEAY